MATNKTEGNKTGEMKTEEGNRSQVAGVTTEKSDVKPESDYAGNESDPVAQDMRASREQSRQFEADLAKDK